jgi:hypothetical protein
VAAESCKSTAALASGNQAIAAVATTIGVLIALHAADVVRLSGKGRPLRQAIIHKLGLFAFQQFSASCLTLFQVLDVDF